MTLSTRIVSIAAGMAVAVHALPALAGLNPDGAAATLPSPGILGLVAVGIVGAIAIARLRG